jgi:adenosylhomocysteinase
MTDPMAGRMAFVADHMSILGDIAGRFRRERPFDGMTVATRIHVEPKTGVLLEALAAGGARVVAMGNKATTDDATAQYLIDRGIAVLGARVDDDATIQSHMRELVASKPDLLLDNGAEIIELLVTANHKFG